MQSKIIVPHSKKCVYRTVPENLKIYKSPWGCIDDNPHTFLDKHGQGSGSVYWIRISCNDTTCKGVIAVRGDDIIDEIKFQLPSGL
jgi:hypothetical protein